MRQGFSLSHLAHVLPVSTANLHISLMAAIDLRRSTAPTAATAAFFHFQSSNSQAAHKQLLGVHTRRCYHQEVNNNTLVPTFKSRSKHANHFTS